MLSPALTVLIVGYTPPVPVCGPTSGSPAPYLLQIVKHHEQVIA